MKTINLDEAAKLLMLHPQTILGLARTGQIPAAKPGKRWVFIDIDLFEWLRGNYASKQFKTNTTLNGEKNCYLHEKTVEIGTTNLLSRDKLYTDLLEPKTKKKQKK